jgi:hypothetical protein
VITANINASTGGGFGILTISIVFSWLNKKNCPKHLRGKAQTDRVQIGTIMRAANFLNHFVDFIVFHRRETPRN